MRLALYFFLLIPAALCGQTSQGPRNPELAENTSCPFSYSSMIDYLPAENVLLSDDVYATASHCDCCDANTRCLQTSGYGFTIPSSATIEGIVAEVEKKASPGSIIQDNGVQLMKANEVTGISYASAANWPLSDTYFVYGGPESLWGSSWTPAEINDAGFGLAFASISYTCNGNNIPAITYIDNVRITVYFTDVATGIFINTSSNASTLITYPNPTADHVRLSIPGNEKSIHLVVTDITGKMMDDKDVEVLSGTADYTFQFSPGIYMMHVNGRNVSVTQKLIVE